MLQLLQVRHALRKSALEIHNTFEDINIEAEIVA